ncbi:hypothetical protein AAGG52_04160 [Bacillus licheniformis]
MLLSIGGVEYEKSFGVFVGGSHLSRRRICDSPLFRSRKTEPAKSGGSDLLVSITDQKLMTAYYENQNKLYEEKMTDYPAMALDRKKRILYYTNTDNSNVKHLIRLDLQSGKKQPYIQEMNMSTGSVYRRTVRSCS